MLNIEIREGTYEDFKKIMDVEIKEAAQGFVRIGYLLKMARDTDVLKESGYNSVSAFAQAEYGLTRDVVSRYIAINDKFSENGYSDKLQEKYEGFGVSKLAEMLTMSDEALEQVTPDMTRKEIIEIKKESQKEETAERRNEEENFQEEAGQDHEENVQEVEDQEIEEADLEEGIDPEDTATTEEEKQNAKKLHVLKMLEKYYTYLNDDDLRVLEAMLEDGKRRKREYGSYDVGSTL